MSRILTDYHMHSNHSPDGKDSMEALCLSAIEKGLTEIAITDHFEIYHPNHDNGWFTPESLDRTGKALTKIQEKFAGKLIVRRGIELGQPQADPAYAARILKSWDFDYIIGSVHKILDLDYGFVEYTAENIPYHCQENLKHLFTLADQYDFDCMGHMDIIKRYAKLRSGILIDMTTYREPLTAILRRVIERGKGIEINTSGLRQNIGEALPGIKLLKLYKELGGEILVVGSDAHNARDVAADFDTARELALSAGFTRLARYEKRTPSFYDIT